MVITLLGENNNYETPSKAELEEWADEFGLSHPVVADDGMQVVFSYVEGGSVGLPSFNLLAEGMEVVIADDWVDESDVQNNLP
jgi:hypothetical protein